MKKKFNNLESLRRERIKLQAECKEKETELTRSLQFIQENFGTLVLTSLLPFKKSQKDSIGNIIGKVSHFIGRVMPQPDGIPSKLQPILKLVQMALAGLVYRYVRRLFRK